MLHRQHIQLLGYWADKIPPKHIKTPTKRLAGHIRDNQKRFCKQNVLLANFNRTSKNNFFDFINDRFVHLEIVRIRRWGSDLAMRTPYPELVYLWRIFRMLSLPLNLYDACLLYPVDCDKLLQATKQIQQLGLDVVTITNLYWDGTWSHFLHTNYDVSYNGWNF